mgnify:FL=1
MAIYDNPPSIDPNTGQIPDYKQVMVQNTDANSPTYGQYVLKYEYTIGSTKASSSLLTEARTEFDQFEGDTGSGDGTDDGTDDDTGDATNITRITQGRGGERRAREEAARQKALAESLSGTYDPEAMANFAYGGNFLTNLIMSEVPIIGGLYAFGKYRTAKELKDNFGIDKKVYSQMQKEMKENNLTFDQAYSKTQGGSAMTATDDPNYDPYGNIYRSATGVTAGRAFGSGYEGYRDKSISEERGGFVQGTGEAQEKSSWDKIREMVGYDKDLSLDFSRESYSANTSPAEFDRIAQINRDYANAVETGDYSAFGVEKDTTDSPTNTNTIVSS